MSTPFREFLRQHAEKYQAEVEAGRDMTEEWRGAIERLFHQIREWLKDSDPQGVIEIEESQQEITEPGLGRYRVPRLNLRVLGKWIGIIPKARKTVGRAKPPRKSVPQQAEGRVDITDELRRYVLYRLREQGQDLWMIEDLAVGPEQKLLDQETFEQALMSYLQ